MFYDVLGTHYQPKKGKKVAAMEFLWFSTEFSILFGITIESIDAKWH